MRRFAPSLLLPVLLLALAACRADEAPSAPAATDPAAPGDFDASAWVRQTSAEWDYNQFAPAESEDYVEVDDAWQARAREHALALDARTDWMAACDEVWGEPTPIDGGHFMRGRMYLERISDREALIEIVCDFGAYQGTFVLVHVDGPNATVVRAPAFGEGYVLRGDSTTAVFGGSLRYERLATDRMFSAFALARGIGDCGEVVTYRLLEAGRARADVAEARARDCDGNPEAAPPPEAWPVVFPAGAR